MEYYESIDGFEIARRNVNVVVDATEGKNEMNNIYEVGSIEYVNTLANWTWGCTILSSFIVWIVCIVSLILNIIKKNTGKAIVSGIGLVIPIATIFFVTLGRALLSIDDEINFGIVPIVFGVILQIIFIIMPFIFCFSKNKNVSQKVNENNENIQ